VVVFGDHGEAWGEHKRYFHGQDLTEEQLRVPLLVVVPGEKPVVVDDEVGLIDMGPTLVDLVGAAPCPASRPQPAARHRRETAAQPTHLRRASAFHRDTLARGDRHRRGKKLTHKIQRASLGAVRPGRRSATAEEPG